jgi:predicted dehydrogenase
MSITSLEPDFEPVRVGMIGVGRHARLILLPALSLVPEIQLCCVSTAHTDTARAAEKRYRVKAYIGFEDMLDHAGLEAVLVVGGQQGPETAAALEAGLHVWCETPAVTSTETAAYVREQLTKSRKILEIGSCLRHAPIYRKMRDLLLEWREESPSPRLFQAQYYPYVGHFYNLMLYLNGAIDQVFAVKGALETLVTLRFANGDLGSVISRRFDNDSIPFEAVSISSEAGLLSATNGRELSFHRARDGRAAAHLSFDMAEASLAAPTFSMPYGALNQLYLRGYVPELDYFARRVREGKPPVCDLDEMERTLLVREAINRSAASGAWETVTPLGSSER